MDQHKFIGSNQYSQQPIIVAGMVRMNSLTKLLQIVKDKWLENQRDQLNSDDRRYLFFLSFDSLREKDIIKVLQRDEINNKQSLLQAQEKLKNTESIDLQITLKEQNRLRQQKNISLTKEYLLTEKQRYRVQKYRKGFMLRDGIQVSDMIELQTTQKNKPNFNLQMKNYQFIPEQNSAIYLLNQKQDQVILNQYSIKLFEYKRGQIYNWEEQNMRYRILLIPKEITQFLNKYSELDQVVIKSNVEKIYAIYVESLQQVAKIINYILINNKKQYLEKYFGVLKRAARIYKRTIISSFLPNIRAFTKTLPQPEKKENETKTQGEEMYINDATRQRGESITLDQQSQGVLQQQINGIQKEQTITSSSNNSISNSPQSLKKKSTFDKFQGANLLQITEQEQEQEGIQQIERGITSKKSSIILHKVEMNDGTNDIQQNITNNCNIINDQTTNKQTGQQQITQNLQNQINYDQIKESIDSEGNQYTTEIIQCQQPESPTIKIKKLVSNNNIDSVKQYPMNAEENELKELDRLQNNMKLNSKLNENMNIDNIDMKLQENTTYLNSQINGNIKNIGGISNIQLSDNINQMNQTMNQEINNIPGNVSGIQIQNQVKSLGNIEQNLIEKNNKINQNINGGLNNITKAEINNIPEIRQQILDNKNQFNQQINNINGIQSKLQENDNQLNSQMNGNINQIDNIGLNLQDNTNQINSQISEFNRKLQNSTNQYNQQITGDIKNIGGGIGSQLSDNTKQLNSEINGNVNKLTNIESNLQDNPNQINSQITGNIKNLQNNTNQFNQQVTGDIKNIGGIGSHLQNNPNLLYQDINGNISKIENLGIQDNANQINSQITGNIKSMSGLGDKLQNSTNQINSQINGDIKSINGGIGSLSDNSKQMNQAINGNMNKITNIGSNLQEGSNQLNSQINRDVKNIGSFSAKLQNNTNQLNQQITGDFNNVGGSIGSQLSNNTYNQINSQMTGNTQSIGNLQNNTNQLNSQITGNIENIKIGLIKQNISSFTPEQNITNIEPDNPFLIKSGNIDKNHYQYQVQNKTNILFEPQTFTDSYLINKNISQTQFQDNGKGMDNYIEERSIANALAGQNQLISDEKSPFELKQMNQYMNIQNKGDGLESNLKGEFIKIKDVIIQSQEMNQKHINQDFEQNPQKNQFEQYDHIISNNNENNFNVNMSYLEQNKEISQHNSQLFKMYNEYNNQQQYGQNRYNNIQSDQYSKQLSQSIEDSPYIDFVSPTKKGMQQQQEQIYTKILSHGRQQSQTPNKRNTISSASINNNTPSSRMINKQTVITSPFNQDQSTKLTQSQKQQQYQQLQQQSSLSSQSQKITQSINTSQMISHLNPIKKYIISKIMIYWFEEEHFDNFYQEVKDIVLGDHIISLQEQAQKYSNQYQGNINDDIWQINTNIEINLDDQKNEFDNNQFNEVKWRTSIRNNRNIDIVNGELKIKETLENITEYGREQFILMSSSHIALQNNLYAILHIIIDVQTNQSIQNQFLPQFTQIEKNKQHYNNNVNNSKKIEHSPYLQHLKQIIRCQEKFFYYLIPEKYVIIPKRYLWIQYMNNIEIKDIINNLEQQKQQQLDKEIKDEIQLKLRNKLEELMEKRVIKILQWQGKMQAELLMNLVRKEEFDKINNNNDKINQTKNKRLLQQQQIIQTGIPQPYRLCVYAHIIDLHTILLEAKNLIQDIFQTQCNQVIDSLNQQSQLFCNPLIISLSSLISLQMHYHQNHLQQVIFTLYRSYLLYRQMIKDTSNIQLNSSTINILINLCQNFREEEQIDFPQSMLLSSKQSKFSTSKVYFPRFSNGYQQQQQSSSASSSQQLQFKLAYQQFDSQLFFAFDSLMGLLSSVDSNFIYQNTIYRLTSLYPEFNFNLSIPHLYDLIYEGSYSYFSIGEMWSRLIDNVFIELIDIQKLEINFFLFCVALTIISLYLENLILQNNSQNIELSECLDEQIQEYFCTYLNFKRFFDILYKMFKSEILIYKETTAYYQNYMEKINSINNGNIYREERQNMKLNKPSMLTNEECQYQLEQELIKLNKFEQQINYSNNNNNKEVELFIFLNDIPSSILSKSILTISYSNNNNNTTNQNFIPLQLTQKGKKIVTNFKTKIPYLKTQPLFNQSEYNQTIQFEIKLKLDEEDNNSLQQEGINNINHNYIYFQGQLEWDPVQLFYGKKVIYLLQKNNTSNTLIIDKSLTISIYLEPVIIQTQLELNNRNTNKHKPNNIIQDQTINYDNLPLIYQTDGSSIKIFRYDLLNMHVSQQSTSIDPLRMPCNISKLQSQSQQNIQTQSINDWLAKISYLISQNSSQSLDEKLKLLYLAMKSAFGQETSLKNVLLLQLEIGRMDGIIYDFESLILRASQIIGRKLNSNIHVNIKFINITEGYNQQQAIIGNKLLQINPQTLENEYILFFKATLTQAIHVVDIRSIITQVHSNLLLKNGISPITHANLIQRYQLTVIIDKVVNEYIIDENGMVVITKKEQDQQIVITKLHMFQNIFIDYNIFSALFTSSSFFIDYFCQFNQMQFFTKQLPLVVSFNYYDIINQKLIKSDYFRNFSVVDQLQTMIEYFIDLNLSPEQLYIDRIKCFYKRQLLYINDNLVNQIDIKYLKSESINNELFIQLDLFETDEVSIKISHNQIVQSKLNPLNIVNQSYPSKKANPNSFSFQAVVLQQNGLALEKLYKLPMKDIYNNTKNIKLNISSDNLFPI